MKLIKFYLLLKKSLNNFLYKKKYNFTKKKYFKIIYMRRELKKTEYVTHYGDLEISLLEQIWENEEENMTEEDYKNDMKNYLYLVTIYNFKLNLINTKFFAYFINPEVQEWVDENIFTITKNIVEKIAFVVPTNIVAQISIEQTMEEANGLGYKKVAYFDTNEEARFWLLENN